MRLLDWDAVEDGTLFVPEAVCGRDAVVEPEDVIAHRVEGIFVGDRLSARAANSVWLAEPSESTKAVSRVIPRGSVMVAFPSYAGRGAACGHER